VFKRARTGDTKAVEELQVLFAKEQFPGNLYTHTYTSDADLYGHTYTRDADLYGHTYTCDAVC
jgi:hypothetical protein